jgi:hypothetical protein
MGEAVQVSRGDQAIELFHQAYDDRLVHSGAGKVLVIDGQD